MTVTAALDAMLAIYSVPGTWTHEGIAQDAAGRQVAANSREAAAWSLEGALERVIGDWEDPNHPGRQALLSGVFDACGVDLMRFNDAARRQDVVVALLRHAQAECAAA